MTANRSTVTAVNQLFHTYCKGGGIVMERTEYTMSQTDRAPLGPGRRQHSGVTDDLRHLSDDIRNIPDQRQRLTILDILRASVRMAMDSIPKSAASASSQVSQTSRPYLSLRQTAKYCRIAPETVAEALRNGDLIGTKSGNMWRVHPDSADAWTMRRNERRIHV